MVPIPREYVCNTRPKPCFIKSSSNLAACWQLRFSPTVECCLLPNLCELDEKSKSDLWWREADYAEFLRTRVAIGKAYKAVAKRRGVAVSSEFPPEPLLSHESRLGLNLGRKKKREKMRRKYIDSVLQEQIRQKNEGKGEHLDLDRLGQAAKETAEEDQRYAVEQARKCHVRLLEDLAEDDVKKPPSNACQRARGGKFTHVRVGSWPVESPKHVQDQEDIATSSGILQRAAVASPPAADETSPPRSKWRRQTSAGVAAGVETKFFPVTRPTLEKAVPSTAGRRQAAAQDVCIVQKESPKVEMNAETCPDNSAPQVETWPIFEKRTPKQSLQALPVEEKEPAAVATIAGIYGLIEFSSCSLLDSDLSVKGMRNDSKGFGLTRARLQEAGLSVTGHGVRQVRRREASTDSASDSEAGWDSDAGATSAEEEAGGD